MAFSDLQMKVVAENAVEALKAEIAPLKLFTTSYNSEIEGKFGQAIAIPTVNLSAGEFNSSSNNLEGSQEFGGEVLTLDKDYVSSMRILDRNLAYTGIDFAGQAGKAIGKALGRACNSYAIGLLNNAAISAECDISSKGDVTKLVEVAYDNDIPVKDSVVLLTPEQYAKTLATIGDYSIYGTNEIMKTGIIKDVLGFSGIACTTELPNGVKGAIVPVTSLATASLYMPPVFPESFANVWKAVDEDNGLAMCMTEHSNTATGYGYVSGRVLFGAKLIGNAIKLV